MNDVMVMLGHWQLDVNQVRDQVYRAPTPRERERWHAVWLLAGAFLLTLQLDWGEKAAPDHPRAADAGLTRTAAAAHVDER